MKGKELEELNSDRWIGGKEKRICSDFLNRESKNSHLICLRSGHEIQMEEC